MANHVLMKAEGRKVYLRDASLRIVVMVLPFVSEMAVERVVLAHR